MKRIFNFLVIAAICIAASCSKNNEAGVSDVVDEDAVFTATIDQVKTTITIEGNKGKVEWVAGDVILINDIPFVAQSSGVESVFIKQNSKDRNPKAPFTATYGDVNEQLYSEDGSNCPMAADPTNERDLYFKNICAVVKLTLSNPETTVKSIFVEDFKLDCGEGIDIDSPVEFYIAVPPTDYKHLRISVINDECQVAKKIAKSEMSLAVNTIKPITVTSLSFEHGYTSSSNGNMVVFSTGNLYKCGWKNPETGAIVWAFTTKQSSVAGVLNLNDGDSFARDLFGFGTSGHNIGAPAYQPWEKTNDETKYYSASIHNTDADWGMLNPIQHNLDDGECYMPGTYYTPSKSEWESIMINRATPFGHRYAAVKVQCNDENYVAGILVFADDFTWPDGLSQPTVYDAASKSWNNIQYSYDDFKQIAANGAAFLPGAGLRTDGRTLPSAGSPMVIGTQGETVCNVLQYVDVSGGFYWASDGKWVMNFYDEKAPCVYEQPNCFGAAVRLVK